MNLHVTYKAEATGRSEGTLPVAIICWVAISLGCVEAPGNGYATVEVTISYSFLPRAYLLFILALECEYKVLKTCPPMIARYVEDLSGKSTDIRSDSGAGPAGVPVTY
ncbi:hypothetical protein CBL_09479 [Carabus blaptoides fortunei]